MSSDENPIYQKEAALAFNKQSGIFDDLYQANKIVQYKRQRVRNHVEQYLKPGSSILELNAGTGDDAVYFATRGYQVHATDIAEDMQKQLIEKARLHGLSGNISTEVCSYTELETLQKKGPYDCIFSNFAGLNCTPDLKKIMASFYPLLTKNGTITLVIMPPFCLWELTLVFKNDFKTAFRRFNSKSGRRTQIEGEPFTCWYYSPLQVKHFAANYFKVEAIEGLCTVVPPSFFIHFPDRYPKLYSYLIRMEHTWKSAWPWKNIGDYFIITLRKQ